MNEVKPPERVPNTEDSMAIFLAGSIEMGVAENWQQRVVKELADHPGTIYNPRRDDWDASWVQSINNKQFNEQVTWELDHIEEADIVVMYFVPDTKSPITLLELGLAVGGANLIVCCPEGFWRKGNVDVVCARYGIEQANTLDDLILRIKEIIR